MTSNFLNEVVKQGMKDKTLAQKIEEAIRDFSSQFDPDIGVNKKLPWTLRELSEHIENYLLTH